MDLSAVVFGTVFFGGNGVGDGVGKVLESVVLEMSRF